MRLVTVAHGTRHATGNEVARALTAAAGSRLGLPAVASYVELCSPLYASLPAEPSVVVPLLLSTGYHVREDLGGARPLGPDPLLASAQVDRLLAGGARPGQPVTMVAAGSNDPLALRDLHRARDLLAGAWGGPVSLATLAGLGLRPAAVVRPGDAVSPYLLAEGYFADRTRRESVGASVVADVLGPHPLVVDLVVQRATALLGALTHAG
ncbi:MAG TPA: CbiX/SirB N-terminal domain-containing protein [Nocardioides sp.]|uniref:sirohydrochlorin chelatase n=1 Tax=Nocardioides sp. TaxID=35761 RepID=UPI002CDA4A9D|nr:CbiX/SirB N-terminal domain-containing protein [Nocardioides sp.]HTW14603.1 CbiX/SirB N-terminal domain-containing protein [Nocardioides sp.]